MNTDLFKNKKATAILRSELAYSSGKVNDSFKSLIIDVMKDLSVIHDNLNLVKKEDKIITDSHDQEIKDAFLDLENLRKNIKENGNKIRKFEKELGFK